MINIVCTDLDGTLLNSGSAITPRTLVSIRKWLKPGRHLIFATARPFRDVILFLPEEFHSHYIICYNGAVVYHQMKKVMEFPISVECLRTIVDFIQKNYSERMIAMELDGRLYSSQSVEHFWKGVDYTISDISQMISQPVNKILVDVEDIADKTSFINTIGAIASIVITDQGRLGQIMAKNTNKFNALATILKQLNLNILDMMAFGDDYNDLELIQGAGYGVAMGNAVQEVKAAAKLITGSNDADGIALVLEKLNES